MLPARCSRAADEAARRCRATARDAAVIRGGIVFRTYCVLCHGASGKGDGRAAKMYTPRPANLTVSPFNDKYKEMIIRGGGASVGRSAFMPPWGDELTEEQITDLVAFLRELRKTGVGLRRREATAKLRSWIGKSVSRRLAIPGLLLILLLLVQAALSGASAIRLVGRLEDSSQQTSASIKLTERLLATARELSDHARATVARDRGRAARHQHGGLQRNQGASRRSLVDEISTELSARSAIAAGRERRRVHLRGQRREGHAPGGARAASKMRSGNCSMTLRSEPAGLCDFDGDGAEPALPPDLALGRARRGPARFLDRAGRHRCVAVIAAFAACGPSAPIRGSVIEPVQYAALTARRLATGDYADVRDSDNPDECGELVRAMRELCQQLIERRTRPRPPRPPRWCAFRVRSGLDLASSRVLITDPAGRIIYANAAAKSLMDRMQPGAALMNRSLDALLAAADANEGAAPANPAPCACAIGQSSSMWWCRAIANDSGEMLGRVAEWIDRTDEVSAQHEVAAVVHAAGAGDFSQRIPAQGKSRLLGRAGTLAEPAHRDLPFGAACHVAAAGGAQPGRTHAAARASLSGLARQGVR